jgi:hypothetical protein
MPRRRKSDSRKGHAYYGNQHKPDDLVSRLYEDDPPGTTRDLLPPFPYHAFEPGVKINSSQPPKAKSPSEQKIRPVETSDYPEISGNRILNAELLLKFVSNFPCPVCLKNVGYSCVESSVGVATTFSFRCKAVGCPGTATLCSSNEVSVPSGSYPEINNRVVSAAASIGKNHRDLVRLFSGLDIPPPSRKLWDNQFRRLKAATELVAEQSMNDAAREIRELTGSCEAVVSNDGTWQRRGFSSLNGVATTIGVEVKKVVDTQIKTLYCNKCSQMVKKGVSKENLAAWRRTHVLRGECEINHSGSAGKMESDGMLEIFRRSEKERGLQYLGYLGDGDSKSFLTVSNANPPIYTDEDGDPLEIRKLECCGHIQKRMGNQLASCIQLNRGKKYKAEDGKMATGIGGKGALTKVAIRRIQGHYGAAIRSNKGNLGGMKRDIQQILLHRRGNHVNCGEWCPAKEGDLARANKSKLPKFVCDAIQPVFDRLSSDDLLEKCLHGGDQNANESLHSGVWQVIPKVRFVGRKTLSYGVSLATVLFNEGEQGRLDICSYLGYKPGKYLESHAVEMNKVRIQKSEQRCDPVFQTRRTKKRTAKAAIDEQQKQTEGVVYKQGDFST